MLANFIEELTHLLPDSKQIVAVRYGGISACLPLLALLFLSAPSFYLDRLMNQIPFTILTSRWALLPSMLRYVL
jgi:hypothetical protein